MSMNMCIWRHKLCNAKTGVGPTFTWSNEPWCNECTSNYEVENYKEDIVGKKEELIKKKNIETNEIIREKI